MSMANYGDQSRGFTYDVFLSFRGEDTRHKFIGYLRDALWQRGINAFFDDKNLRIGEDISPALLKAIEESKISVIVFSENYASSRWCLGELVKIIECTKRNSNQIAFPIFYHVDPSDVRNQRNSYEEAMVAHQNRFGKDSENLKAWKAALSEAADLKGHHIHTGFEIDHIKEIVEKVHAKIAPKPLLVGENPVGLDQHIEEVKSLLDMKPNDDTISMLGICGLGGIGKTELAKALYNKIVHQFEAASFLANVREKSNKINGPEDLQKTLLSEMFEQPETELGSTSKGVYEIKHKLGKKKVLLVLDDVDEMEQLENLAGGNDWFGPGSRIIITTRDKGLLIGTHSFVVQKIYEMTKLNDQHSLELFCRKAFGKSHPKTGYEAISSRAVGYAKGLPLALKVIGSNLATRKNLKAWEHALKDYERIPRKGMQDVLKVSYDVLEPYAQSVFLDIACFFKGKRIEYVEEILDEFSAASNIEELVNKSLLIVEHGYLNMHDLIQDMGREIVRQESPNPAKRSRLWFHQDVIDVLSANDSGSDAIQGIMLDPSQPIKVVDWNGAGFEKMNCLRILIVRKTKFSSEPKHLSNHLRLLDWELYPSKSFPAKFYPRNIIILNLPYSRLTMEEPFKQFSYLTVMDFSHNQCITTMPDVSNVESLRELRLDDYIVDEMNKPLKIHLMHTSIKKLPNSIGNLIGLVSIDMQYSENLEYLPSSLFTLPNVVAFKFGGCSKLGESFRRFLHGSASEATVWLTLKTIHFENSGLSDEDIQAILTCYPKLEELIASDNNLVSLPACIKESAHLTNLDVSSCNMLQKIPESTNLRILNVHGCVNLEHISELPCTIKKIDARYCFNFSSKTSDMLWDQVKKERHGLEIVMPRTKVPEWFDYRCKGGVPCLWVHGNFPNVAVALVFRGVVGKETEIGQQLVELNLVINGQYVPRKGYYDFKVERNHVLVCDLRLLFNDEEWLSLNALFLEHEWNQVQVPYEASLGVTLSEWGVFVYKPRTINLKEQVQFICPDSTRYSNIANIIVPPKNPMKMMMEKLAYDEMLKEIWAENIDNFVYCVLASMDCFLVDNLVESMNMENQIADKLQDPKKKYRDFLTMVDCAFKGNPLDENYNLEWMLSTINKSYDDKVKDEPPTPNLNHKDELLQRMNYLEELKFKLWVKQFLATSYLLLSQRPDYQDRFTLGIRGLRPEKEQHKDEIVKPPMDAYVGETSTSSHKKSLKAQVQEILMKIFLFGMSAGKWVILLLLRFVVQMKIYVEGIFNELREAHLSFPTLDSSKTTTNGYRPTSTTMFWGPDCGSSTRRWRGAPYLSSLRGGKGKPTISSSYRIRCRSLWSTSHTCYYTCQSPMNLRMSQETRHVSICLISSGARIQRNLWCGTLPKMYMYGSTGCMRSTCYNLRVERPAGIVQQEHFSGILRTRASPMSISATSPNYSIRFLG
ncbi:TMV resistance protein N [Trifolium pratense]|uniref:TMV resistance protein N n=1 Tax=Trifolium pratense TaxID=57577 RepID=A0A2K3NPY7_TRIPR|nr:TMV resistance protein N [Trifolium pratense]